MSFEEQDGGGLVPTGFHSRSTLSVYRRLHVNKLKVAPPVLAVCLPRQMVVKLLFQIKGRWRN